MKKDKPNIPHHYGYSDNKLYNRYLNDVVMEDWISENPRDYDRGKWKNNNRRDIFHDPLDGLGYYEDPYTVAQKYLDRRQFPHG